VDRNQQALQEHRLTVTPDQDGARLDVVVAAATAWTRNHTQQVVETGAVYVDRLRQREPGSRVRAGQEIRVLPPAPDRTEIGGGGIAVVYQSERVLIVNKPAGLPTQPPPRGGDALNLRVQKWYADRVAEGHALAGRPGDVHRLDRDVSGLVAFGLDRDTTRDLAGQFRDHSARRRYLALVRTAVPVPPQTIREPLLEVRPGFMTLSPVGIPAVTHLIPLAFDEAARLALVLVELETGRTHQVRVHLAWSVGAIAGDLQYGDVPGPFPPERVALHAATLQLHDPATGQLQRAVLTPPLDFWTAAGIEPWPLPEGWQDLQVAQSTGP
jgi:23S rRNA pseudouridine1911/1915/1917 synthase